MSRLSPLVAPIIDEDFDLCISETNLPFPYSDHCSTGPPSLYEFDVAEDYDEEDEEGGYFDGALDEEGEEEEEEGGDVDEDDTLVETKEVLLDGDSDSDPSLAFELSANGDTPKPDKGAPSLSRSRNVKQKQLNDLSDQLHSRLENIRNNNKNKNDTLQTPTASTPKTRPYYSRQSYSFDSNEGWHEEDYEEDDAHKNEAQDSQTGLTGIIQTVTSSATSVAYAVGKHWSKVMFETSMTTDLPAHTMHIDPSLSHSVSLSQWVNPRCFFVFSFPFLFFVSFSPVPFFFCFFRLNIVQTHDIVHRVSPFVHRLKHNIHKYKTHGLIALTHPTCHHHPVGHHHHLIYFPCEPYLLTCRKSTSPCSLQGTPRHTTPTFSAQQPTMSNGQRQPPSSIDSRVRTSGRTTRDHPITTMRCCRNASRN